MRPSLLRTLSGVLSGATTSPAPPQVEGYEILRLLGRGGMGSVYLAEDEALQRHVALKLLRHDIVADPEGRERFLREARAMAKVRGPFLTRRKGPFSTCHYQRELVTGGEIDGYPRTFANRGPTPVSLLR